MLKNQWGPVNVYLNLAGSVGSYDHIRFVNISTIGTAKGKQKVAAGLGRVRFSYLVDQGSFYLKPIVDFNATYVNLGGYTETGAAGANLSVSSANFWLLSATPALEIGGELKLGNGTLVRPYLRAGASFFDRDKMSIDANFANAPVGVTPFRVTSNLESTFGVVEAGLYVLTDNGWMVRLNYDGRFSNASQQHAGSIKIGHKF